MKKHVYLVATPLHLYYSIVHMLSHHTEATFVLSSYSKQLHAFFNRVAAKLQKHPQIDVVHSQIRSRITDYSLRGYLSDLRIIRTFPEAYSLVNFSWFPESLTFFSNMYFRYCQQAIFIEDASMVYLYRKESRFRIWVRQNLFLIDYTFASSPKLTHVYVTQTNQFKTIPQDKLMPLDDAIDPSTISDSEYAWIFDLFEWDRSTSLTDNTVLVLSQPLATLSSVSKADQKHIFTAIVQAFGESQVVFKKHPRDNLVYPFESKVRILPQFLPAELVPKLPIHLHKAVSVASSATSGTNATEQIMIDPLFFQEPNVPKLLAKIECLRN